MAKYCKQKTFKQKLLPTVVLSLLCVSLSACADAVLKGDVERGQEISAVCAMCHGDKGISNVPIYPNLAGQKEQYLVIQLKAFRSGERVNMAMTSHAQKLSDQDIADLSAYYAQLKVN
ncbi:cytochrome c [Glaciecola sp. MH2013]|uniref:c-type cytochrome n=1 Tax=Glaciecola sp. MH2013 TaxID=2785524 RepID=UPI00189F7D8C|nr:cytochrome c [Glaciecola sp. MH2013]MBF7073626.1 cytochrome c [Glaciecola sp. MH2013]